jgi:hypothetical protein
MKGFLISLLAISLCTTAMAQSSKTKKKKTKDKDTTSNVQTLHMGNGDMVEPLKFKDPKAEKGKKTYGRKTKEPAPPAITVVTYYDQLPLRYLPQVSDYKNFKASQNTRLKVHDDNQFRESMIRTQNLEKGYVDLITPGNEGLITRMQLFKAKPSGDRPPKILMAVEQSNCTPTCTNEIHIYRKDTGWVDVTSEVMPKIDYKYIYNRLKEAYKKQYLDLDLFEAKDYKDEQKLKQAIVFNIVPGEQKIVVKEQYLPLELYTIKFDENAPKGKFTASKSN